MPLVRFGSMEHSDSAHGDILINTDHVRFAEADSSAGGLRLHFSNGDTQLIETAGLEAEEMMKKMEQA